MSGNTSHAAPLTAHCAPLTSPVGVLGGTFDPIHLGHLRIAEEMAEAIGIAEVRILPTGTPPHRNAPAAPAAARLAMARLAIQGNPRFVLDEHEVHKTTPCYMVDTLSELRAELGLERPLVLFVGGDAFLGLTTWHAWQHLFELAHIAVAQRPGYAQEAWTQQLPEPLRAQLGARRSDAASVLGGTPCGRIYLHTVTQLDISASRVRDLLRTGASCRYLVTDAVLAYIEEHQLYRA